MITNDPKNTPKAKSINIYKGDLPSGLDLGSTIAIDTEAMGLNNQRDRLCLVQISDASGNCHLVHFPTRNEYKIADNLIKLLADKSIKKIFHYARFDIAIMYKYLGIMTNNIYCTKIASKLARTYTEHSGLKDLCTEVLEIRLNKQQQSSDWGRDTLTRVQIQYAIGDVLYLHKIKEYLESILHREGRYHLLQKCLDFLPHRALMDLEGWADMDIYAH